MIYGCLRLLELSSEIPARSRGEHMISFTGTLYDSRTVNCNLQYSLVSHLLLTECQLVKLFLPGLLNKGSAVPTKPRRQSNFLLLYLLTSPSASLSVSLPASLCLPTYRLSPSYPSPFLLPTPSAFLLLTPPLFAFLPYSLSLYLSVCPSLPPYVPLSLTHS